MLGSLGVGWPHKGMMVNSYELESKLLKEGYIGDDIGCYYRD